MKVTANDVNDQISGLISLAITHSVQHSCTPLEEQRIRLCLEHPSETTQRLLDECAELLVESLEMGVPTLLNHILFPDDE